MDNKGQNFAHLKAVEAYLKTGTPLPCDLTFVIEGEEEVGSANLAKFLKTHRAELHCDAVVVSDTDMPSPKHPALTYSLRGIIAFEITVRGPSRDLHSGIFGGAVENPAMALSRLLAQLRDANGRMTIPGFYDDVAPLSALRTETIRPAAHQGPRPPKIARREKIIRRTRLHAHRTAQRAPDIRDQRPDERLPGRGQQDHCAGVGAGQNHLPPRAEPKTGEDSRTRLPAHQKNLSADGAAGNRGRSWRGGVSGFAHESRRRGRRCARSKPRSAASRC